MERTLPLDDYAGRPYFLAIRGEPDLESPDEFAVTLYYKDAETEQRHEVARIDNTEHGGTHIDKFYTEEQDKQQMDLTLWGAVQYLIDHHPEYARRYRNKNR